MPPALDGQFLSAYWLSWLLWRAWERQDERRGWEVSGCLKCWKKRSERLWTTF